METKLSLVEKLNATPALMLPSLPEVGERFKQLFAVMHRANPDAGAVRYEAEKFHFAKLLQDKPDLQQCTRLSLYGCFLDAAVNGLSFDPGAKHLYVVSFNVNVGKRDAPQWEKRASLMVSGGGELSMRMRQGQIRYADNPVLVYEGDEFSYGTKGGKFFVDHTAKIPRESENIIACYLRIERMDGSSDYKVMSMEEVNKLKKFSKDPNSLAWTSGLPGMVQAKTVKHAFRNYPRVQMGSFTQLASNTIDAEEPLAPALPDYGLNGHTPAPISAQVIQPIPTAEAPQQAPPFDDSFAAQTAAPAATVTHDSDEF